MIFVTVGTHEQPFDRLVKYVDQLKKDKIIEEDVVMQTGFSTYEPCCCTWSRFFPYPEMQKYVAQSRISITHGGPSSFIMPLQIGKIPVVVPRQKQFGEHVNNHQVEFVRAVAKRQKNIIVVEKTEELKDVILNYDSVVNRSHGQLKSNNIYFNQRLAEIVEELFHEK